MTRTTREWNLSFCKPSDIVVMTSFAKVCIDLSNNLRNFRFTKSSPALHSGGGTKNQSSPSSSPQMTSSLGTSAVATNSNTTGNGNNSPISNDGSGKTAIDGNCGLYGPIKPKSNGCAKMPMSIPTGSSHHKKQAPPVPTKSYVISEKMNLAKGCSQASSQPSSPKVEKKLNTHSSSQAKSRYQSDDKEGFGCQMGINRVNLRPKDDNSEDHLKQTFSTTNRGCPRDVTSITSKWKQGPNHAASATVSPVVQKKIFDSNYSGSVEGIYSGTMQNFPSKITFSPTMAHRIANLTRSCQYNYGSVRSTQDLLSGRSDSSSRCTSPVLPRRGATVAAIKQRLLSQGLKIDLNVPVKRRMSTRYRDYMRRLIRGRPVSPDMLWKDEKLINQIIQHLPGKALLSSCAVCKMWFKLVTHAEFYDRVTLKLDIRQLLAEYSPPRKETKSVSEPQEKSPPSYSENTPLPPADYEEYLEKQLTERLKMGIRRNIKSLLVVFLADRYAHLLINALITALCETGNTNDQLNACIVDDISSDGLTKPLDALRRFTPQPLCSPATPPPRPESRQPLAPVQSFVPEGKGNVGSSPTAPTQPSAGDGSSFVLYRAPLNPGEQPTPDSIRPKDSFFRPPDPYDGGDSSVIDSLQKLTPLKPSVSAAVDTTSLKTFSHLSLRCCSIVDTNLEQLIRLLSNLDSLELQCCNDLSEMVFWTCLTPSMTDLVIFDCINVSDESMGAITQVLPELRGLTLQAYHVTDAAFSYFSPKQRLTLETFRLIQCMDITNQGVINLAFALPSLRSLSLSGCTNLSDDGLDIVCENLKKLTSLDISWCAKISDSGLECVACDLVLLKRLILDRCVALTDIGISHLATMPNLKHLSLRWCVNLSDGIIPHLLCMTGLVYLSVAGCKRLTEEGLCQLARHPRLRQLEVAHCPGATYRVKAYLTENQPDCQVLD
ncbi:unnamed protein product [Calicophoron daubneyi]|uniref:F-box/LRR-repeat protein 15-like leucin rich repeat domain-containing protein n=1 Tax=Calicophoron daubneyi TaxID=300641 RepID=A0AAV2TFI9_CALDB